MDTNIKPQTNNNNNSNSMEIDNTNTDSNHSLLESTNNPPNKQSTNNPPKRRKKRTREEFTQEMNIDMNNNECKTKIPKSTIKRRKISSNAISITPMSKKWEDKYNEYKCIIYENYKLLLQEVNKNKLLIDNVKEEIESFTSKSLNSNNINLSGYNSLICKLIYGRNNGLNDVVNVVKNILCINDKSYDDNIREIILKSLNRKLYGVKPITKTIDKNNETIIEMNENNFEWYNCRIYEWEFLNVNAHIPYELQIANKNKKNISLIMSKYEKFCKKYNILNRNTKLNMNEKERELQKILDLIIAWEGKQELLRKKKELQKSKKEEMEKLKKERAEKKAKEKQEKLLRKQELKKQKLEKQKQLLNNDNTDKKNRRPNTIPIRPTDPNKPPKPANRYFIFKKERRDELIRSNPNISKQQINDTLAKEWNQPDQEYKKKYLTKYENRMNDYKQRLKDYKTTPQYEQYQQRIKQWEQQQKQERKTIKWSKNTDEAARRCASLIGNKKEKIKQFKKQLTLIHEAHNEKVPTIKTSQEDAVLRRINKHRGEQINLASNEIDIIPPAPPKPPKPVANRPVHIIPTNYTINSNNKGSFRFMDNTTRTDRSKAGVYCEVPASSIPTNVIIANRNEQQKTRSKKSSATDKLKAKVAQKNTLYDTWNNENKNKGYSKPTTLNKIFIILIILGICIGFAGTVAWNGFGGKPEYIGGADMSDNSKQLLDINKFTINDYDLYQQSNIRNVPYKMELYDIKQQQLEEKELLDPNTNIIYLTQDDFKYGTYVLNANIDSVPDIFTANDYDSYYWFNTKKEYLCRTCFGDTSHAAVTHEYDNVIFFFPPNILLFNKNLIEEQGQVLGAPIVLSKKYMTGNCYLCAWGTETFNILLLQSIEEEMNEEECIQHIVCLSNNEHDTYIDSSKYNILNRNFVSGQVPVDFGLYLNLENTVIIKSGIHANNVENITISNLKIYNFDPIRGNYHFI